jgi:hypothetical protein
MPMTEAAPPSDAAQSIESQLDALSATIGMFEKVLVSGSSEA